MPKIFISFFLIGLSLVIGAVLVLPRYQELGFLKIEIAGKEQDIQTKEEYVENLQGVSSELQEYERSFAKINMAIPSVVSIPGLFNFLQKAASQNGLILTSIGLEGIREVSAQAVEGTPSSTVGPAPEFSSEPAPETAAPQKEKGPALKRIAMSLSLNGSYAALKSFLANIEKNARLFEVKNISFSSPSRKEEKKEGEEVEEVGVPNFSFNLKIEVYSY